MTNTIKYNNFTLRLEGENDFGHHYKLVDESGLEMVVMTDINNQIESIYSETLENKEVVEQYTDKNYDNIEDAVYKWSALTTIQNLARSGKLVMEADMYKKSVSELIKIIYKK